MVDEARPVQQRAGRVAALDGLRGLVIIAVVVNHGTGILWPLGRIYDEPLVAGALGGGAVTVFFVVGAFIVTHALQRDLERDTFDAVRFYLRRLVRLGPQLVLVCAAVWIANSYATFRASNLDMAHNVMGVLTYTFNIFATQNLFVTQPAFGHLWYLSVQQQCYLVLPLALIVLARARWAAFLLILVLIGLIYVHRQDVLADQGWVIASAATTTRADGLLWGVAVALALPWLGRVRGWGHILWISGIALVVLKIIWPEFGPYAYLGWWSLAFTGVAGVVVVAIWQLPAPTRVSRFLSLRPLQRLGKASLAIYIWHLPIFVVLRDHTPTWQWGVRTAVAFAILAVVVVVTERWVDEPVRRLLATRPVFRIRPRSSDAPATPAVVQA
ncbi:acyltransferase family protein [Nocardioides sp.]|uniref:acyltransferase family protein n=1 Tax=Nocardioides sp. TaxID=35761 RepID=UPI0037850C05